MITREAEPSRDLMRLAGLVFLVLLTLVAYEPSLHAGFVWDDDNHATALTVLDSPGGFRSIWFDIRENSTPQYYPLTFSAFWLQRRLWGLQPFGFHAVNLVFQALNTVLLWRLLAGLRLRGAWLAAALFAIHPVQVMSVAWITELKNLLAGFFMLLSAGCFLPPGVGWPKPVSLHARRGLAFSFFLLAMLSKTAAMLLPIFLALAVWWREGRLRRADALLLAVMAVLGVAGGAVTVWVEQALVWQHGPGLVLSWWERVALSGHAYVHYLRQLLWPAGLAFLHPKWNLHGLAAALYPLATVLLLVTLFLRRRAWGRGPFAALLMYYLSAPALVLVQVLYMMRYTYAADHWVYFGNAAAFALLAAGLARAAETLKLPAIIRVAGCAALLAVLAAQSRARCSDFQDEATLWRATLQRTPDAWLALNNLGILVEGRGRPAEAEALFRRAMAADPGQSEAYCNLGLLEAKRGHTQQALYWLREAIRLDPLGPKAHYNLGLVLARSGQLDEAIEHYRAVFRVRPDAPDAQFALGNVLARKGEFAEAEQLYREVLRQEPEATDARVNLASVLGHQQRFQEALTELDRAAAQGDATPALLYHRGFARYRLGRMDEAATDFERLLGMNPTSVDALYYLASIRREQGHLAESVKLYRRALAADPKHQLTMNDLADTLATAPAPLRDPAESVRLGEALCQATDRQEPIFLDTLAAAYAAEGSSAQAIRTASEALKLAGQRGLVELAGSISNRLEGYRRAREQRP